MARTITIRPRTISRETALPIGSPARRKVAAYARVSTDHEEQATSYEAQCGYYTRFIKSRPDWEFVAIYADDGISGVSTKNRDGFNRMVRDAKAGKIDLILTKSVSRFARNTVDSLTTIRELKAHGTEVYFEKENIWTFDSKGELLISIMSSLSQEESRSISENVKWGHRKKFATGRFSLTYSHFLGYDKGEDGTLVINEDEAPIVRQIYSDFLLGLSPGAIAHRLTEEGIPTPAGKTKWHANTVQSILRNEKYRGSALLQKSFTPDFLTGRTVKNRGELPQYFIENSHPAIIPPEQFELVQEIFGEGRRSGKTVFCGKILCGECGGAYGAKVWHSSDKYRRVVWQCNKKYSSDKICKTPYLTQSQIEESFIKIVNRLVTERQFYITELRAIMDALSDTSAPEEDGAKHDLQPESEARTLIEAAAKNVCIVPEREALRGKDDEMVAKYNTVVSQRDAIQSQIGERVSRRKQIDRFIRSIEGLPELITEFDAALWAALVGSMTVYTDGRIVYHLSSGTEIE